MPDKDEVNAAMKRWRRAHPMPRGTIDDVVDHIDHIVEVAGIDHVGLGSDYDGVSVLPTQMDDVTSYPFTTQALLDRGYNAEQIRKILGENLLRAFRATEEVAAKLQAETATP